MEDPDSLPEKRDSLTRPQNPPRATARPTKSDSAFRTISEVSLELDVPQHVLRFWESKFTQIKPLKRGGGRRYYRPEDVQLLSQIRDLLYRDGYTIRGVQKLLRESTASKSKSAAPPAKPSPAKAASHEEGNLLREMLTELLDLRRLLADARRK